MGNAKKGVPGVERAARTGQPRADGPKKESPRELWDPSVSSKYWLSAMSQAMDAWMRSVQFLELMQQSLQMAIAAKRYQDGWWMQSEPPSKAGGGTDASEPPR